MSCRTTCARFAVTLALVTASPVWAQDSAEEPPPPRNGSAFRIPLGSFVLPGLGQYLHGATGPGLGYTGTAAAGLLVARTGDAELLATADIPRQPRDQLALEGAHVQTTAGFLSAWDAFHRAVPGLQREGRYRFLGERESLGDLLGAPFDPSFLKRPTTLIQLAYTGLITGFVLGMREPGAEYEPFRPHDAAFVGALSFNAAVGEEAAFRGWLLPVLHQKVGEQFWLANSIQASIFGAAHLPGAGGFALVISGWGAWEGWLTRRNDWSVRESIFHHFWYDVAVAAATLLVDERETRLQFSVPAPRF